MGTIMDLTKGSSHDYVDHPFWSAFQIKVTPLQEATPRPLGDDDLGKV